jgi:hypothetical protein
MIASVESEITFPIQPLRVEDYRMTLPMITTPRTFVSYSDSNVVGEKESPESHKPEFSQFRRCLKESGFSHC